MNTNITSANQPQYDEFLMKTARRRVNFKTHAVVYVLVNTFISALCLFSGGKIPVDLWLAWGFGLAIQGVIAYTTFDTSKAAEREYEKLVRSK
jgi:hypothetical protein